MKKAIIVLLVCFAVPYTVLATMQPRPDNKDTLKVKCVLSSAKLFYGLELGEKPLRDLVDTLVGEISFYDTAFQLNLIIVSGKDLGFTNERDIRWEEVLDSAIHKGYKLCPPQTGPDLYVISKNMPRGRNLITQKVSNGRPVFIGMNKARHQVGIEKKLFLGVFPYTRKVFFDYIFCLKSNSQKNAFVLGYSNTFSSNGSEKDFIWAYNDMFIFVH